MVISPSPVAVSNRPVPRRPAQRRRLVWGPGGVLLDVLAQRLLHRDQPLLADLVRYIARSARGTSWSMSGSSRRDSQSAVSLQDPVVRVEACAIRLRTEGLGFNGLWVLWYVGVRGSRDRGAAVLRCRWPSRHRNEFRVGQGGSMRDDLGDNPHRCARPAPPCRLFSRSTVRGVNSPGT